MPTIKKFERKKPLKQGRSKEAAEIYNTSKWKKLRNAYFMLHPICEMCLKAYNDGNISLEEMNPTEEIHHIKPILKANSKLEMIERAFDGNNLIALCKFHHHKIHNNMKK